MAAPATAEIKNSGIDKSFFPRYNYSTGKFHDLGVNMEKAKFYKSIVGDDILDQFSEIKGNSLFNNFQNTCSIEQAISCASVFWPEIVEEDGFIFIKCFYEGQSLSRLKKTYGDYKREIERRVNSWSIADLFLLASTDSIQNDQILDEFSKTLRFFWELRFKQLFPCRDIVVELGNELYGERGITIVVYEK